MPESLPHPDKTGAAGQPELVRGIGLLNGIALNMINMIGVGPFW